MTKMQAKPALVAIAVQPPESVQVGEVFPVTVWVGVASGAPVGLVKVKAAITDITSTTLTETVDTFVSKVCRCGVVPVMHCTAARR